MNLSPIASGFRLGILGGGQLGKMLCLAAHRWDVETWVLDPNPAASCSVIANRFVVGDFNDLETVLHFGRQVHVLTIEIEHVNITALQILEKEGIKVCPSSNALSVIKNKGLQKAYLWENGLPTTPFTRFSSVEALLAAVDQGDICLPFVQKTEEDGYDGRGVSVVRSENDLRHNLLSGATLVEPVVEIQKEIAVIAARNTHGEIALFPPVEMAFHPTANLVEYLFCPADIPNAIAEVAAQLAHKTIEAFDVVGLLAVEMFWTREGAVLINEVAPRPHNSGHHTLDAHHTSQFEQHLRAILGFPLGDTSAHSASVMVNLLGEPEHSGAVHYAGIEKIMQIPNANIHLYGKLETKPFRKMGHLTLVAPDLQTALSHLSTIKKTLRVVSIK
ncbi:MAG: 5-(carboxyamino)imidazole ribonucleotide synthase [Rhodothermia bacterium]|nr:5-(carboxyamino)imidazole ribonucleotide synthase [Rhodothermia bacterium]